MAMEKSTWRSIRPSTGYWFILKSSTNFSSWQAFQWGASGDVLVQGDYDGDGMTDIALYRPSSGDLVDVLKSSTGFTTNAAYLVGPQQATCRSPGDYDGDGNSDIAIYRPSHRPLVHSEVEHQLHHRRTRYRMGCPRGHHRVAADYDGDGKTDVAVYRPSKVAGTSSSRAPGSPAIRRMVGRATATCPCPSITTATARPTSPSIAPRRATGSSSSRAATLCRTLTYQWGTATDVPVLGRH